MAIIARIKIVHYTIKLLKSDNMKPEIKKHIKCGGELQFIRESGKFIDTYKCKKCGFEVRVISSFSGNQLNKMKYKRQSASNRALWFWYQDTIQKLNYWIKHPEILTYKTKKEKSK